MNVRLTDLQRSVLCWLHTTDGVVPNVGLFGRNPELGHEIIMALQHLDLLDKEVWENKAWKYPLTEEGVHRSKLSRYGDCPSCVQAFCVCRVRLVCALGCPSAGCHGSHE